MKSLMSLMIVLVVASVATAGVADFEDLTLETDSHWSGTYPAPIPNDDGDGYPDTSYASATFDSGDITFDNYSGQGESAWGSYSYWGGFGYSNMTDITTSGLGNQFSAYATGSAGNQYGIGSGSGSTVSFAETVISGMWVTNTTYAYLSMRDGDSFTTMFGATYEDGENGPVLVNMDDPDWFKLTITGSNNNTADFYLADYRGDSASDYIVDQWNWVDLSDLGNVTSLSFSFDSSDHNLYTNPDTGVTTDYGMNNPAYFAMDNFNGLASQAPIPEPMTVALLGLGGLLLRRKKA